MRIVDRYLLRNFLRAYLICLCSITGLYIVFDASTNLDGFVAAAEIKGGLSKALIGHYSYRALYFFDQTSGILALTAAMFTVTWIQRHNELTALMAAGISKGRVVRPVIVAAIAVSLLAAANRELIIPRFRRELSVDARNLLGANADIIRPRYDNRTDILLRGWQGFANEQRIGRPNFLLPPDLDRYGGQIVAEDAYYEPPQGDRPGGYHFKKVELPRRIGERPSIFRDGQPVVITPQDASDWLKADECFVVSEVDFEQLTGGKGWKQFSSTLALIRGLANPSLDFGADVRVAIHGRVVQPILDITLLFLGLPLVLAGGNRNVFVSIGVCSAVTGAFSLIILGCRALGSNVLIEPALACWAPLLAFVPVAAWLADPLVE
jgi:lipopolysaccharide export system permease protein